VPRHDHIEVAEPQEFAGGADDIPTSVSTTRIAPQPFPYPRPTQGDRFMRFHPLQDRVLVRRVAEEEVTAGGIIIPDTVKEKPMEGEVVAVGPGARGEDGKIHPLDVKAGDRVLFGKWSGTEIKLDGEELMIMKESDLLGIMTGSAGSKRKAA
jgi:chaperonin GroES